MTYQQQQFLNQFDQPIRNYIIEYCKRLSEKNYDVYILLARKAACFMSVLESLGFVSLNGIVVSDRVQEFKSDWLVGKKIAIIDDTIISGTTINRLIKTIESFKVANISVHTFCVDSYWYNNQMLTNKNHNYLVQPYMKLEHSSCIRFCKQIVNALSIIPRPYNIDFPTYEISKLTELNYHEILSDAKWKIVNTTTYLQSKFDVNAISLNFRRELLAQFFDFIGCDLHNKLFAKVRIFTKRLFDNNTKTTRYLSRVVPYIIFDRIEVYIVDKIISAISHSEGKNENELESELMTESAKIIFLQYYFSVRLMKWWLSYTEMLLEKKLDCRINKRSLSLLFSPKLIDIISDFKYDKPILFEVRLTNKNDKESLIDNSEYNHTIIDFNPFVVKQYFTQAFLDLYYQKELPARRKAKKCNFTSLNVVSQNDITHRLEDGLSMIDLKYVIAKFIDNSTNANLILSTFLDNAIDAGIAVPITVYDKGKGLVYRGFRHGEEVIWGDSNDFFVALFFELIFGKNGKVPKLHFEKLLVLFVRIGLKLDILSDYYYSPLPFIPQSKVVHIGSYLYGHVSTTYVTTPGEILDFNPITNNEDRVQWTSGLYCRLGLITSSTKGYELHFENLPSRRYVNEKINNEAEDLDFLKKNEVLSIAYIFKLCLDNKLIDDDKLVILTSCVSILDNISSINAELQLYVNKVESYLNYIQSGINKGFVSSDLLKDLREPSKQVLWTALNSGKFKFISFRENKGKDLLKEIYKQLVIINPLASSKWLEYWSLEMRMEETNDDVYTELSSNSGRILIDILNVLTCTHILLYELWMRGQDANNLSSFIDYEKNSISIIESGLSALTDNERDSLESTLYFEIILSKEYKKYTNNKLINLINSTIFVLNNLKDNAITFSNEYREKVPLWGKYLHSAKYISLIHIKPFRKADIRKLNIAVEKVIDDVELEEYQGSKPNKSLMILSTKGVIDYSERGLLIGGKGIQHKERMIKLAGRLLLYFQKIKLRSYISFFPSFEDGIFAQYNRENQKIDLLKQDIYPLLPYNNEEKCIKIYTDEIMNIDSYRYYLSRAQLDDKLKVEEDNDLLTNLKYSIIQRPPRKKIFISYSNEDIDFKRELVKHLNLLNKFNIVDTWSCEDLREDTWDEEIQRELDDSDVVIFMLSVNFFNSNYILEKEVLNVTQNKRKRKVLCVLVSNFTYLNNISDYIKKNIGIPDERSEAVLQLKRFQYVPYGIVKNNATGYNKRLLIPLSNYKNLTGNDINEALASISDKLMKMLSS